MPVGYISKRTQRVSVQFLDSFKATELYLVPRDAGRCYTFQQFDVYIMHGNRPHQVTQHVAWALKLHEHNQKIKLSRAFDALLVIEKKWLELFNTPVNVFWLK